MPIVTDWSRWCSSRMVFDLSSESGFEYRPSLLETLVNPPYQFVAIAGQPEGYRSTDRRVVVVGEAVLGASVPAASGPDDQPR
ncbi:MAG: hypothetical protein JSS38_18455 [Nitrospira sp.]|nr:hypothetical protein [Nitrospira sp.]